ncbi:DUF1232 domain-containing protein [Aerococcaceae bacterium DSM 111020]|nr:DUF1232 domain-containing protein [Aerococcaceae bacterium DSM 111020]
MKNIKDKLSLFEKLPIFFKSLFKSDTPKLAKLLILFTLVYVFSPVDLLPTVVGPLGLLDDALLIPLMTNLVLGMLPKESIIEEIPEDKLIQG